MNKQFRLLLKMYCADEYVESPAYGVFIKDVKDLTSLWFRMYAATRWMQDSDWYKVSEFDYVLSFCDAVEWNGELLHDIPDLNQQIEENNYLIVPDSVLLNWQASDISFAHILQEVTIYQEFRWTGVLKHTDIRVSSPSLPMDILRPYLNISEADITEITSTI